MRFLRAAIPTLALIAACSGGSDPAPTGGGGGTTGPMSATVNGSQWTANSAAAIRVAAGLYSITGIRTAAPNYTMVLQLANIGGAGTYPLGVTPQIFGGSATVSSPTLGSWVTPLNGAAGSVTITTLTDSRIAGSFEFTGTPVTGSGASVTVASGVFDMPTTGAAIALPDNAGSKVTGTINGTAFAAAAAGVTFSGSPTNLIVVANNIERNMAITIANVTAAGTYALSATSPVRTIQITGAPGNATATWGSQAAGGSGSVTITSITATRIIGSYTATLAPVALGATGNLTVSGNFNMGR